MTVLHLTTFLQGGAGRGITDLALQQKASGMCPVVVTSSKGEDGYENYPEYLATLRQAGIPVHLLDSLFKRDIARNLAVVDAIREWDARVIHAHAAVPSLIGLLCAARASRPTPVVQTMHGWGIRKSPEQAAADVSVMKLLDAVVTTSNASGQLLAEKGVPAGMIRVIPCGLAADPPGPVSDDVSHELRRARIHGVRAILCIGSITGNKNQRLLLEALPAVLCRQPVLCAFIGEGSEIDELLRRAQELNIEDSVRFYGHRPNAAAYLADADLLVAPSVSEGQGLAVIEAFRAGVPVVASDTPALKELVSCPDLGWTFPSGSIEGLACAITKAFDLPLTARDRIVRHGRQRFAERFTMCRMIESHRELYGTVLAARGCASDVY